MAFVYLMKRDGIHKIGYTRDLTRRAYVLKAELVWSCDFGERALEVEKAMHRHFQSKLVRKREWFSLDFGDIEWIKSGVNLYQPCTRDFASSGATCWCHKPEFMNKPRWKDYILVPLHEQQVPVSQVEPFSQVRGAESGGSQVKPKLEELFRKLQLAKARTAIKRAELSAAALAEDQAMARYRAEEASK